MTAPMISNQWPRFVLPVIRKEWEQQLAAVKSPAEQLFGMETSDSSVEYSQGIGNMGLFDEYNASTAEGMPAAIKYDSFSPLYETTFTHKEYSKGLAIERKLWDDNRSGTIKRKATSFGTAAGRSRAYHQSSVFNNAFATVEGGDGVYLCSASHPLNKNSSDVFGNLGNTALSYDAVKATLILGSAAVNDRDLPMPILYNVLYVPTGLQGKAYEIVNAMAKPGTADNDANFLQANPLQVVVDPYLTDANNWFMVDSAMSQQHLLWFDRIRPEVAMDPSSDYSLVAKYRGYMRYSFGWDDANWIYGHSVT